MRILQEFRREGDVIGREPNLTSREIEVLQLVADRLSNSDIADRLTISEHTVKNHLKNILAKLHVRNRRQAAALGLIHGWVRVEPPT
jgi:DNA-binding CsgD family transcriptional regulator